MVTLSAVANPADPSWFDEWGLAVLLAVIGSSLLATVVGSMISALRESAGRRRDRYADAVSHLVGWGEFPYRIYRRTGDDAATLKALADLGHDLQERMANDRAWVASESRRVARAYDSACNAVRDSITGAAEEAWNHPALTTPAEMHIGRSLGTGDRAAANSAIDALNTAIRWRFGWRRLVPGWLRWDGGPSLWSPQRVSRIAS